MRSRSISVAREFDLQHLSRDLLAKVAVMLRRSSIDAAAKGDCISYFLQIRTCQNLAPDLGFVASRFASGLPAV